jgi:hypothetical protein
LTPSQPEKDIAMKTAALVLCALAAATLPALAGTREDVLSSAVRCGGIANDRAWLDCYYGAAQPMRAQLGLIPAPAAQTRLVPGGGTAPMPAAQIPAPAAPRQSDGGIFSNFFGGNILANNVGASAVTFDKRGFFTITLANGEVWRQEQGDSSFADRHRPAPRTRVTIRQGALGSANLKIQGDNNVYKVRRLR